jgi:prevent-host-death family protein
VEKTISAADARRRFSEVLRGVKAGQSYIVTSHGRVVARIAPVEENQQVAAQARRSLLSRLRTEKTQKIGRWSREEMYE